MRVLILGGSRFLGRHAVESALARGHRVTVFNRGRNNGDIPDSVEILVGNRDGDLDALRGRDWDAVVDTSGYVPRIVRETGAVIANEKTNYIFVSSLSVYTSFAEYGLNEAAPVGTLDDPTVEKVDGATYGPLNLQIVDARDLTDWMILMAERGTAGTFNATGPESPLTMEEFLLEARKATGSDADLVWASDEFLEENGVAPWSEMPMYLPAKGDSLHFMDVDVSRAIAAGLTFRPLSETIEDTLAWTQPPAPRDSTMVGKPGIDPEKEASLLAKLTQS
jgi:2'-hydroxyisoflavone reductase